MIKIIVFCLVIISLPARAGATEVLLKEEECENMLVALIDNAFKSIDISVYSISNKRLVNALIAAYQRGIKVRILTDRLQSSQRNSLIWKLWLADVPVRVQSGKKLMHAKVGIYDARSVSTGSMNWTESAVHKNAEVCDIFINRPDYAQMHLELFEKRWARTSQEKSDNWLAREIKLYLTEPLTPCIADPYFYLPIFWKNGF